MKKTALRVSKKDKLCYDTFIYYNIIMNKQQIGSESAAAQTLWERWESANEQRIWQDEDAYQLKRFTSEKERREAIKAENVFEAFASILYVDMNITYQKSKKIYSECMKDICSLAKERGYDYKKELKAHFKKCRMKTKEIKK